MFELRLIEISGTRISVLFYVLAISQGGGLMLKEQGLVFELQNGYFAIFRFSESTHFNLNYTGRRATFVMQTDIEFDKWVEGKNNWGHSKFSF